MSDRPVVLVVEDEPDVAESYELWLRDTYEVRRATSGTEALDRLHEDDVDVVLLDRMMPGMSGREVLEAIRDRNIDVRVAMVTAVDPDFDIIEMGFDEYVTKPPTRDDLRETVAKLLARKSLDADLQEYHALVSKRVTLEAESPREELTETDEYSDLLDRIERQRELVDEKLGDLTSATNFVGAVRELVDGSTAENGPGPEDGPPPADDTSSADDPNGGP